MADAAADAGDGVVDDADFLNRIHHNAGFVRDVVVDDDGYETGGDGRDDEVNGHFPDCASLAPDIHHASSSRPMFPESFQHPNQQPHQGASQSGSTKTCPGGSSCD